MANLNLLMFLNSYDDCRPSNSPSRSNFKWTRDINGIPANNPLSVELTIAASANATVFSGSAVKKFVYIESDGQVSVTINGTLVSNINPIVINSSTFPGFFVNSSSITSLVITNLSSSSPANVYVAAIE